MRTVKETIINDIKVTVFSWNEKYLLKFEWGTLEQTYKIDAYDVYDESIIDEIISDPFISEVKNHFINMSKNYDQHIAPHL